MSFLPTYVGASIPNAANDGVLFIDSTGLLSQVPEFTLTGVSPFTTLNATNIVGSVIRGTNRLESDNLTSLGGTLLISNLFAASNTLIQTTGGGNQSYLSANHRFVDLAGTEQLTIQSGLVKVPIDATLQLDKQELRQKVTGAAPAAPPASYMHFYFRIIAGIRTPCFKGQDGVEHTITFV